MSIVEVYNVSCNGCGEWVGDTDSEMRAVQSAIEAGWLIVSKREHYCPKCRQTHQPDSRKEAAET